MLALQNPVDPDSTARALVMLDKACKKGSIDSCWFAGRHTQDEAKAKMYYKLACTKGPRWTPKTGQ